LYNYAQQIFSTTSKNHTQTCHMVKQTWWVHELLPTLAWCTLVLLPPQCHINIRDLFLLMPHGLIPCLCEPLRFYTQETLFSLRQHEDPPNFYIVK